ncbi:MAG: hypothetical protein GY781_22260 [Gammaproteobacteria bacterium]|nr:hypothetical protein [Gammaproteobacteria bacterium]
MQPVKLERRLWIKRRGKKPIFIVAHDLLIVDANALTNRLLLKMPLPDLMNEHLSKPHEGIYLFPFSVHWLILDNPIFASCRPKETVEDFLKTLRPEEYLLCEQDSFQNKATYCPTGQLPDIELFIEEKKENNLTVIRPAFSKPV